MMTQPVILWSLRHFGTARGIDSGFRVLGWSAVTLLATAGFFVVAFAAIGDFRIDGFFLQLANLADRYGTADPARRTAFQNELLVAIGIVGLLIAFFRRGSLVAIFVDRESYVD